MKQHTKPFLCRGMRPGIVSAVLALASLTLLFQSAAGAERREYAIKAAFLFHFTQFVVWPPEAMPPPGRPIRIGVLEPNRFGGILEEIVRDETVEGRPIEVVHLKELKEATNCQILFIPSSVPEVQREAIATFADQPVLLVSEDWDFVRNGGMVSLVRERERIAIVINRSALAGARLDASARLLRLAKTIGGD